MRLRESERDRETAVQRNTVSCLVLLIRSVSISVSHTDSQYNPSSRPYHPVPPYTPPSFQPGSPHPSPSSLQTVMASSTTQMAKLATKLGSMSTNSQTEEKEEKEEKKGKEREEG